MPLLTRVFIKSALVYLVLALLVGLWTGVTQFIPVGVPGLELVFFHLFMVGWVTQLIFGVAFWFLPKQSQENPRGNEKLMWMSFWLLNFGLVLRVLLEPQLAAGNTGLISGGLIVSALAQWLAGILFAVHSWGRIKPR